MDIRQLTYFSHVVDLGSFSRAAAFLHVAQPALSRQISRLETELKERLLIRNGRGVVPTESGIRLLGHARSIIALFERAHEDMENARLGCTASIAIGMPASLSHELSTALIGKLHTEIPEAKIHILTGRSTQLQEWLMTGRMDMAVLFDAPSNPMLEIRHLYDERLHLFERLPEGEVESEGPPISLAELANSPLIITSRPNRVREILDATLARTGRKLLVECELDSLETTFDLVESGRGKSVGSRRLRRTLCQGRRVRTRRIVEPELLMKVQIVQPSRRLNSRVHDRAVQILSDICLELLHN